MVGKRQQLHGYGSFYQTPDQPPTPAGILSRAGTFNGDLESGKIVSPERANGNARPKPSLFRFRDAARTALQDERREELKRALLNDIHRHDLEKFRKSDEELKAIKNKKVRLFYEEQNDRLNDWLEVDAVVMAVADDVLDSMDPDPNHDGHMERAGGIQAVEGHIDDLLPDAVKEERASSERKAIIALNANVVANVLLVVAKLIASFSTGSLSLIASMVDSVLDLVCTLIIWSTNKLVQWRLSALRRRFPVGRRRLEPIGILVFSIIMIISFFQILQESVEKLLPGEGVAKMLSPMAIGALLATIIIKGSIGLCCIPIKTPQVQALVQDAKTDVIFNGLSLLFPLIGYYADAWWLDPVGAGLLSLFIIWDWSETCFENVTRLSGQAASDKLMKKLLYLGYRFAPVVDGFKSVTAYHAGDGIWVEYDVLLKGNTKLARSHDIAETLQYCAEGLCDVDRCFVSTDYSISGPSGHNIDC